MTATMSPKRARKRATVWGVRDISGTSTMAPWPRERVRSVAWRYTSVLPDPVTPSMSTAVFAGSSMAASTHKSARRWLSVSESGRVALT